MDQNLPNRKPFLRNEVWALPIFLVVAALLWLAMEFTGSHQEIAVRVALLPQKIPAGFHVIDTPKTEVFLSGKGWDLMRFRKQLPIELEVVGVWDSTKQQLEISPKELVGHWLFKKLSRVVVGNSKGYVIAFARTHHKTVPVLLNFSWNPAPGLQFTNPLAANPEMVTVFGPPEILATITAISTVPFVMDGVAGKFNQQIGLLVPDSGTVLSANQVQVFGAADFFIEKFIHVPIFLDDTLAKNYSWQLFPAQASIQFLMPLRSASTAKSTDFQVSARWPLQQQPAEKLTLQLTTVPPYAFHARISNPYINYQIQKE